MSGSNSSAVSSVRTRRRSARERGSVLGAAACAAVFASAIPASVATADTLNNYVGSSWGNNWKDINNWNGVARYAAEPGDGPANGGDINYISMAHDDGFLYINFN